MSISNPKYVSELNELARLCNDSAESYNRGISRVESPRVAALCKRGSEERRKIAGQLRMRIEQLGEPPDEGGTLRGTAEKALGEAKSLLEDDETAILSELVRVEGHLKDRFEDFAKSSGPAELKEEINKHYYKIAYSYKKLCELSTRPPE